MAGILSMNDVSKVGKLVECVAIVAGIDRIVDMGRTVMSITGDASCAVVMHKTEGHTHSA